MPDDVLERLALDLFALDLNVRLDIVSREIGELEAGRQSTRQKVLQCRAVLLDRGRGKASDVEQMLAIAPAQRFQGVDGRRCAQPTRCHQETPEGPLGPPVQICARRGGTERFGQIRLAESPSRLETFRAFQDSPEPAQMASHGMARITELVQPSSELFEFDGETGTFVAAVVPGIQVLQHDDLLRP